MCYRYSIAITDFAISEWFEAMAELNMSPIYHANGFDFPLMPVITQQEPNKVQHFSWGLVPAWVKTVEDAKKMKTQTLNARSETIFSKPSFRNLVKQNRCLVPASGFFEWMTVGKAKYPFFIHLKHAPFFAFAGLWSGWTDRETGEYISSFTIITTEANELMAKIHNEKKRMPVILNREQQKQWLNPTLNTENIQALLTAYPTEEMEAYAITKRLTNRNLNPNVPEVIEAAHYPELAMLF